MPCGAASRRWRRTRSLEASRSGAVAPGAPSRVLVVKIAAIGDCVNALGAVRGLRAALPGAHLAWLVGRASADAVVGQAPVDDWIVVDDATLVRRRPVPLLALSRELRRRRFDTALVLHRAPSVRLLVRVSGIPRRVGLVRHAADCRLLTEVVVDEPGVHEGERYWRAVERLVNRALPRARGTWTPPPEAVERAVARWRAWGWERGERVVAMAPGGGVNPRTRFELKRWPLANFVDLARRLRGQGVRVLALGLPEEVTAFRAVAGEIDGVETASGDLMLAGALLARCQACVANDSGLLHLAVAAGVPCVAIFGPTNPEVWGPYGPGHRVVRHAVPCQPCYLDDGVLPECRWDHRCMRDLPVEEVAGAVGALLAGARR